jgi:predicted acetyltransferase
MERIEVIPATLEQAPIVANLFELYAHDFSEIVPLVLGPDGRFASANGISLPLYWTEPDRLPFLVRVDGELAGLVFVRSGSQLTGDRAVWDMAEFFIMRGYRRRGVGSSIAHIVWQMFPGPWEIRVRESNPAAFGFWQCAIAAFLGTPVDSVNAKFVPTETELWNVFSFVAGS